MSDEVKEETAPEPPKKQKSEKESLIAEKQSLAEKIGIWGSFNPVENYQDTKEYQRIQEIDKRLAELG